MTRHFGARPVNFDRSKILLMMSLLLLLAFLVVAYLFWGAVSANTTKAASLVVEEADPALKMVEVLIPKTEIKPGKQLEFHMFSRERRSAVSVDARVVKGFEEIVDCYARTLIVPHQPLTYDFVTEVRPTTAISAQIPPGFRAVSISVDATSSVEGWVRAESKVDVVWASNIRGQPGVSTIVENAKILSAERNSTPDTPPGAPVPSTVTLMVMAKDASRIQLAKTTGKLTLNLRGDDDALTGVGSKDITIQDLLGGPSAPTPDRDHQGTAEIGGKRYYVSSNGRLTPVDTKLDS